VLAPPVLVPGAPPPPPGQSPASGGVAVKEFRRICTKANLATCAPKCLALTNGFLLSIEIDGRGTTMTCIRNGEIYSWLGQAALGGFIGDDFDSFFSSVVSGAAGTYMATLGAGSTVHTDLTMQPGQMVLINGDRALPQPPTWGSGGFTVGETASLSISYLQIDTVIQMSEGAEGLTLDSCELTFTDALVLRAAKATFLSQVFRGGIEVPAGADVAIAHSSLSFAGSAGVSVSGTATFTGGSLSFAAGVGTGLTVQQGGAATATGTTFTVAEDATVAVSIKEEGHFEVDSQLVGADGAASPMPCGGVLHAAHASVGGTCQCEAHGAVGGITYPGPRTGTHCEVPPPTDVLKCCLSSGSGCGDCGPASVCEWAAVSDGAVRDDGGWDPGIESAGACCGCDDCGPACSDPCDTSC
jgi:hypothetical protein